MKRVFAGALAASLLAVAAPAVALPDAPVPVLTGADDTGGTSASFRRHFYRGQPYLHGEDDRGRGADRFQGFEADASDLAAHHDYCSSRYRSYDPRSGTFVGYDGVSRPCT